MRRTRRSATKTLPPPTTWGEGAVLLGGLCAEWQVAREVNDRAGMRRLGSEIDAASAELIRLQDQPRGAFDVLE